MPVNELNIDLFISTQCPHCTQALEILSTAVKEGSISGLKITNLNTLSNPGQYAHIRSVPFIQVGDFEFTGNLKKSELDAWVQASQNSNFASYYFSTLLMDGQINQVENFIKRKPNYWFELVKLAQDEDTKMQVRIGITAIFESSSNAIEGIPQRDEMISSLLKATQTKNHALRVDLIYILSLIFTGLKNNQKVHGQLKEFMTLALNDASDEIQEIAEDVLN